MAGRRHGDWATGIAVDSSGDAYVTGFTDSSNFPVSQGAFQTINNDQVQPYYENSVGGYNAFVTELNASGTGLVYSTYLGGNGFGPGGSGEAIAGECGGSGIYGDQAFALALDSTSNVYVTGGACSNDFPITSNAFQTTIPAWTSAFVAKLDLPVGPPLMGTSTLLTASATSATTGTIITLIATVTPASGTAVPTGIVTFLDGTTALGTGTLNTSGQATCVTTQLPVGADRITAVYGGDTNFSGNISAEVTVTISALPPPDFSLSISPGGGTETSSTPATASITVTPVNGFGAAVTFACSGLPSGISCSFNPAKVTPAGAPVSTTVAFSGATSAMARPHFSGSRCYFDSRGPGIWPLVPERRAKIPPSPWASIDHRLGHGSRNWRNRLRKLRIRQPLDANLCGHNYRNFRIHIADDDVYIDQQQLTKAFGWAASPARSRFQPRSHPSPPALSTCPRWALARQLR